jgi:hypothetical protein
MLASRGLRPSLARPDFPFSCEISAETADVLAERLGQYAFRLCVRGVIHHGDGFSPDEPTSYVSPTQARLFTERPSEAEPRWSEASLAGKAAGV